MILWLVTRTTGMPLFGPHAGEVEETALFTFSTYQEESDMSVTQGAAPSVLWTVVRDAITPVGSLEAQLLRLQRCSEVRL